MVLRGALCFSARRHVIGYMLCQWPGFLMTRLGCVLIIHSSISLIFFLPSQWLSLRLSFFL